MNIWERARELQQNPWPKIVTVGLVSDGYVLTGQRRDNQLWTSPGGHIEDGEDIMSAGRREVLEESGIDLAGVDMHLIRAERMVSHRTGKPFVVFAFICNVDRTKATGKNDPDKEVSLWKWVKTSQDTPELQSEARHAKDDFVLTHLGIKGSVSMAAETPVPQEKGRTQKQVSEDLQTAGYDKNPDVPDARDPNQPAAETEEPSLPEPGKLTPEEMNQDPEDVLGTDGKRFKLANGDDNDWSTHYSRDMTPAQRAKYEKAIQYMEKVAKKKDKLADWQRQTTAAAGQNGIPVKWFQEAYPFEPYEPENDN